MRSRLDNHGTITLERSRFADYVTLTKPELTFLSVVTAMAGYFLAASSGELSIPVMFHTLFGTLFIGGGLGALNQYMERNYDAMMRRTENRPLPSGRMLPAEVLLFGCTLVVLGLIELFIFTNVLTGVLAVATVVSYLFIYTPLKRRTWLSTIIGGIPGALPPVMGWTASRGAIEPEALALFAILFAWQMPHFFSLAWMYRKDYERAGYRLLTVLDETGTRTSRQILVYSILLLGASLWLGVVAGLGWLYAAGALALGCAFILSGVQLATDRTHAVARRLFFFSLVYLPALFAVMVVDRL
jgi:protoheme IX farnesyltransferase